MQVLSVQLFILVTAAVTNLTLLFFVYKQNPRSDTNKSFAVFSASVTCWMIAAYLSSTPVTDLFWARATIFFATALSACFFLFAHTLPHATVQLSKLKRILLVLVTMFVMAITISPFAFVAVSEGPSGPQLVVGPGTGFFGAFAIFFSSATVYILWRKTRTFSGATAIQMRFVFTGAVLMLALILGTVMLPVLLFQNDTLVPLMPLYTLIFLGMTAYAIIKHGLFDIRALVARAIAFSSLLLMLAVIYAGIVLIGFQKILGIDINITVSTVFFCLAVFGMLSFQQMQKITERITDKFFFKGRYDADLMLKKIGKILIETIELEDISNQIIATIMQEFRIQKTALLLESNRGMIWYAKGFSEIFPPDLGPTLFHQGASEILFFDNLPPDEIKELFRKHEIALTIPLRVKDKDVAVLVLGNKLSGEAFNAHDISFLEVLAAEIATGIQNAKSFDALKQLSLELELRVHERTSELEESQQKEVAKALEVTRLKDEFVFLAVHELRTPIVAIRGFLELTEDAKKNFPKDIQSNLSAISEASVHMSHLINDLLEIARSDSGSMKVEVSAQEFKPILDGVLREVAPLIDKKKLHLDLSIRLSSKIMCDAQKVKEVLENLVGNAIKYNKEGGSIFINIFQPAGEKHMIFEIRDTGFGIPKDQQSKIFQKFFRAVTHETATVLGTGLGLFITRVLVERMGGTLMFSSLEHEGSTFAFTLPLADRV